MAQDPKEGCISLEINPNIQSTQQSCQIQKKEQRIFYKSMTTLLEFIAQHGDKKRCNKGTSGARQINFSIRASNTLFPSIITIQQNLKKTYDNHSNLTKPYQRSPPQHYLNQLLTKHKSKLYRSIELNVTWLQMMY